MLPKNRVNNPKAVVREMIADKWSILDIVEYFTMFGYEKDEIVREVMAQKLEFEAEKPPDNIAERMATWLEKELEKLE